MNITIDASVFVAASKNNEEHYHSSRDFLHSIQNQKHTIVCPTLVLPECAAAISRPTDNAKLAEELVTLIIHFPKLSLVPIDMSLAQSAAQIAQNNKLRGADSIYVSVAIFYNSLLITWDNEMLERSKSIVTTMTPSDWNKS